VPPTFDPDRRRWLALLAGAAASVPLAASATAAEPVRARQVAPDVWVVQGAAALGTPANRNFISNAGFVVTDDGVVVVDALGAPALADELLAQIRRVTPRPVSHVVVTHYHADHIYGLQRLKAAGAQVLAHPAGRDYLHSEQAARRLDDSRRLLAPWIDADTRLVPADRWLAEPETVLRLGATELRILHMGPAHTPEDLVVHVPRHGVVFCGDLVFRGRVPFVGQADSRRWILSLDRLIALKPAILLPGHGDAALDAMADLQLTRDYLLHLRRSMGAAAQAMEPFDEAYARTDWSRYAHLPLFDAANRMNAYNTYLLMEQQGDAPAPR
jgi:glyoxylase-like metal-dependent hydrolase (beta-lactamase superfamily II)